MSKINLKLDWIHYLSRPFPLLGASLWYEVYTSDQTKKYFDVSMPSGLFIESPSGVANQYRLKTELAKYEEGVRKIVRNQAYSHGLLIGAKKIESRVEELLAGKVKTDLNAAVNLFIDTVLLTANYPRRAGLEFEKMGAGTNKVDTGLINYFRSITLYPKIYSKLIIPHARSLLKKSGYSPELYQFGTYSELKSNNFEALSARADAHQNGKYYTLQIIGSKNIIEYVDEPSRLRETLDQNDILSENGIIRGQVAFPGKVRGKVKVVVSYDKIDFSDVSGCVFVTINSNPSLLPFIKKSVALITDEGGVTCHAAIISRELKLPCVMGTKIATQVLKDGDLVEVDAEKGIVTIIKQASNR